MGDEFQHHLDKVAKFHLHLTSQMLNCHLPNIQRENEVSNFTLLMSSIKICVRLVWGKINKFSNYKVDYT